MLEVKQISKSFGSTIALKEISLNTIEKAKVFGLLGPNGAGKTTLIRIINQILNADSGIVELDGKPIASRDLIRFGYLPEERGLYKLMTVQSHLMFLAQLRGLTSKEASEKTNFWLDKLDIQNWKSKNIESLSKGMSQKIQFIGSILHDPEIVILDEPMSGFDPINVQLIINLIKEFVESDKTIILSTHNMQSVESICDNVALINDSKKIIEDSVWNIRQSFKSDEYNIRYKGSRIAFANGLWVGFEIIDQKEMGEDRHFAKVKRRREYAMNDLMSSLMDKIEIESIEEHYPSMQEIFIDMVSNKTALKYE